MLSMEQRVLIDVTISEANMMGEFDYSMVTELVMGELKANGEPFDTSEVKQYIRKKLLKTYVLRREDD